nr:hypothetical protein [Tanacetum cinerariifolium]
MSFTPIGYPRFHTDPNKNTAMLNFGLNPVELKEPIEDQSLPADASPTALSSGYVVDSDLEKDEKDPKEDPAYYPADRGDNDDDESSNDDDDDDDVEKEEEDKEEEEHLAPADPSDVSTDDLETMTTVNQGMSVEEIKQVAAQRVANAIEAIAIYEAKTNLALKSLSQTKRQKEKVAENASNKRKWEGQNSRCYECGVQGHFKRECPMLKNNENQGNQGGRNNAPARVYAVGHTGADPDANVVTG